MPKGAGRPHPRRPLGRELDLVTGPASGSPCGRLGRAHPVSGDRRLKLEAAAQGALSGAVSPRARALLEVLCLVLSPRGAEGPWAAYGVAPSTCAWGPQPASGDLGARGEERRLACVSLRAARPPGRPSRLRRPRYFAPGDIRGLRAPPPPSFSARDLPRSQGTPEPSPPARDPPARRRSEHRLADRLHRSLHRHTP